MLGLTKMWDFSEDLREFDFSRLVLQLSGSKNVEVYTLPGTDEQVDGRGFSEKGERSWMWLNLTNSDRKTPKLKSAVFKTPVGWVI